MRLSKLLLLCCLFTSFNKLYAQQFADTTVTMFNDPAYRLTLHFTDSGEAGGMYNNAILILYKNQNGKKLVLFKDSVACDWSRLEFKDFNGDKIKDVLIFSFNGARIGTFSSLFIVDNKLKKIIRVKGFEQLSSPEFDAVTHVITCMSAWGNNYETSFYKINKYNKLVDLHQSYIDSPERGDDTDSTKKGN